MTVKDDRQFNQIFIHSELDDYGLDPYEFRIYAHIARRVNKPDDGECWEALHNIAANCRMDVRRARKAILSLTDKNLISFTKREGQTHLLTLKHQSEWVDPPTTDKNVPSTKMSQVPSTKMSQVPSTKMSQVPETPSTKMSQVPSTKMSPPPRTIMSPKGYPIKEIQEGNPLFKEGEKKVFVDTFKQNFEARQQTQSDVNEMLENTDFLQDSVKKHLDRTSQFKETKSEIFDAKSWVRAALNSHLRYEHARDMYKAYLERQKTPNSVNISSKHQLWLNEIKKGAMAASEYADHLKATNHKEWWEFQEFCTEHAG